MLLSTVVALALTLGQVSARTGLAWTPCASLSSEPMDAANNKAKCTTYTAPLCHPGICEAPESANATIDVFVKRFPATKVAPKRAPNVWLLQNSHHRRLDGKANVYTMDHRGTGRGTFLKCEALAKSSSATKMDPSLVPACAKELEEKYGDLAAFSTTSAAMDLVSFISDYGNDASTTLYGTSFGMILVKRVMHLNPPEVTGYVLDGALTTSGSSLDNFYNISATDTAVVETVDAFAALCSEDASCGSHFKKKGLKATLHHLMTKLDTNPKSTCARLVKPVKADLDEVLSSSALRYMLGVLVSDASMRTMIPPIVFRLLRCAKKDVPVLTHLMRFFKSVPSEDSTESSLLLDTLISFSEMWESPTPSVQEMKMRYEDAGVNAWQSSLDVPMYCAFSKEKSPACNKLKLGNYKGNGIIYERDEYWNKAAKIPEQASVLLMSSELDPTAPKMYATALLEALDGENKELVTFKNSTGISIIDNDNAGTCGLALLVSFVEGKGDLSKLNMKCVQDTAVFNWTIPAVHQNVMLSTEDAYNGEFDSSLSAGLLPSGGA